jgi:hypothetical protein
LLSLTGVAHGIAKRYQSCGPLTPNYSYAWNGSNARFNKLIRASYAEIEQDSGMALALDWARKAIADSGPDPSNGAFWWDGLDFKTNYANHPKVRDGFKFGNASDDIFNVQEKRREVIVRWQVKNRKTGKIVDGLERGRYDCVWVSTAAQGGTIFWVHNPDYLKATGERHTDESDRNFASSLCCYVSEYIRSAILR